jgi:hypothetical protein
MSYGQAVTQGYDNPLVTRFLVGLATGPGILSESNANIPVALFNDNTGLPFTDVVSVSNLEAVIIMPSGAGEIQSALIGPVTISYAGGSNSAALLVLGPTSHVSSNGTFTMFVGLGTGGQSSAVLTGFYTTSVSGGTLQLVPTMATDGNNTYPMNGLNGPGGFLMGDMVSGKLVPGPEQWHALGGVPGMTGPTQYRLTSEGELQIEIRLVSNAGTAAGTYTFPNALAAPYLPLATIVEPAIDNASVALSGTIRPRFFLNSSTGQSQIILSEALAAGQQIQCRCKIPLNI